MMVTSADLGLRNTWHNRWIDSVPKDTAHSDGHDTLCGTSEFELSNSCIAVPGGRWCWVSCVNLIMRLLHVALRGEVKFDKE